MWKKGITLNCASNSSKVNASLCRLAAIVYSGPPMVQGGGPKNALKIHLIS